MIFWNILYFQNFDSIQNNPGAMLGAFFIGMHGEGRDKLTLLTSPAIDSFGFWAEQLVAESTGKDGTGIVPIVGEPLIDLENYGSDRFFVYLMVLGLFGGVSSAVSLPQCLFRRVSSAGS